MMWRPNTERSCRSWRLAMSPSCPRLVSIVPPVGPAITACGTAAAVLHDVGQEIFIDSRQTQRLAPIGWDATPSLQSIRNSGCLDGRILRRNLLAAASSCRISPPTRPGRAGSPRQVTGTPTPIRRPLPFPPRLGRPSSLSCPIPQLPGELGGKALEIEWSWWTGANPFFSAIHGHPPHRAWCAPAARRSDAGCSARAGNLGDC